MLRIGGRAAVAAGHDLAIGQQAIRHERGGSGNRRRQRIDACELQLRAIRKVRPNSFQSIHGLPISKRKLYQVDLRMLRASGCVDVAKPFDVVLIERLEQDGIEAAERLAPESGKVMTRGQLEAMLLARRDAGRRATEGVALPQTDFDEHQRCAIARDQVDLSDAATVISSDYGEASLLEEACRRCLGCRGASYRTGSGGRVSRAGA